LSKTYLYLGLLRVAEHENEVKNKI
jgi:hypothetical protein